MMIIDLHTYFGAFNPRDKPRPGFRIRDGTLIVLTHSKPKNKLFSLIPATNISSEHFKCKYDYVYMCLADNQCAKRYNNVPGGKIFFSSHQNFLSTMAFINGIIPTMTPANFELGPNSTITPDEIVLAVLTPEHEQTPREKEIITALKNRDGEDFGKNIRAVQEAQIVEKLAQLNVTGTPTFPALQTELDDVITMLNANSQEDVAIGVMGLNLNMEVEQDVPVDPAEVVEVLNDLIAEGAISATTEVDVPVSEVEKVEEISEMPLPVNTAAADSLQVSATVAPGHVSFPANTLAKTLKQVGEISEAANSLVTKANALKDDLLTATVNALQAMGDGDARETTVDAEIAETTQL